MRENGHITIRDVYYDDAGNITSWATGPSYPWGDCIKDLSTDLARYGAALKLPVLFEEGGALVEEYSED